MTSNPILGRVQMIDRLEDIQEKLDMYLPTSQMNAATVNGARKHIRGLIGDVRRNSFGSAGQIRFRLNLLARVIEEEELTDLPAGEDALRLIEAVMADFQVGRAAHNPGEWINR